MAARIIHEHPDSSTEQKRRASRLKKKQKVKIVSPAMRILRLSIRNRHQVGSKSTQLLKTKRHHMLLSMLLKPLSNDVEPCQGSSQFWKSNMK
ncbi:unnamed protein product [Gongylonema pulchrum]|uniref:Ovule protein n=1 Tax=Gongylonema pulchrum TaxID=637853 RepID=A0A183EKV8_9BILA|nr:unnamed protein product [Gongylonema pulchrum]